MGDLLFERGEKQVWLEALDEPGSCALPFRKGPYVCMVWANRPGALPEQRRVLADALIGSGCRYIVCGGEECEMWHDSADEAYMAVDPSGISEDIFVTTTWHSAESEEDVVFFLLTCTDVENMSMNRYLIVQVGKNEDQAKMFGRLVREIGSSEWAA